MRLNGRVWSLSKESSVQQPPESEALLLSIACISLTTHQIPGSIQDFDFLCGMYQWQVLLGHCVQNMVRSCSDHSSVLTVETPEGEVCFMQDYFSFI